MKITQRLKLAYQSLNGVAIGDAFGESFFGETNQMLEHIHNQSIPATTWEFTDDTVMAIAIYQQLKNNQCINQDELARAFVVNHDKDVNRGYGATARRILREIGEGADWRVVSANVFEGMGSMGNGAAMRTSPIGAFYFDDLDRVKVLARESAEITHANIEGSTGAIAVAVATAIATQINIEQKTITPNEFITRVVNELPDTDTKSKIKKATTVSYNYHPETLKTILGNGSKIMVQDTVPFTIWCAAHNLYDFEAAIWKAVSVLGDRDTICAIVGGIVAMSTKTAISSDWSNAVEDVKTSIFWD